MKARILRKYKMLIYGRKRNIISRNLILAEDIDDAMDLAKADPAYKYGHKITITRQD